MSKFYVALPTHLKKHSFKHSGEKDPTCITVTHYTYIFLLMTEPWKPVGCYQNRERALGDILLGVAGNATMISKLDACKKKAASKAVALFGLDDKKCWTGQNAINSFYKYGTSAQCSYSNNHEVAIGSFASESTYVYLMSKKGKY